jgi:ribose 5-phosphate isomerase B
MGMKLDSRQYNTRRKRQGDLHEIFTRAITWRFGRRAHCASSLPPVESRALVIMSESPAKLRIVVGSDHAGFPVKEIIRKYLESAGYAVDDRGTSSEESVDYPDYGKAVGKRVVSKQADYGIVVCGSGIGISIAANKVPGVRAALAHDVNTARLAREHNNANVLALGGRIVTADTAVEMVQTFLTTAYLGGRHQQRVEKISQIERDERL